MRKFLPRTAFNPQGFTLIELLIVISIIAVLSVVGITVFTGAQKNSRDARRKADITSIANALEANYSQVQSATPYPAITTVGLFAGGAVPVDPQNVAPYTYTNTGPALPAASYIYCARLENTTGGNSSDTAGTAAANGQYYCRKNQQ